LGLHYKFIFTYDHEKSLKVNANVSVFYFVQFLVSFIGIMMAATEDEKPEKIADTTAMLEQLEGAFEKCSGGKGFFGGDFVGFLDVILGSQLAWIKAVERISGTELLDETKVPLLVQWANRFLELDFVKSLLPSVERVEEFGRGLQATGWKVDSSK
jgi:glutathione S-transferase